MKSIIKFICMILAVISVSTCFAAPHEEIPLSIDHVEVHRVYESLVRVILHNTELLPRITVELIQTPDVKLLEQKIIEKIVINDEQLEFTKSTGVIIDNIALDNGIVKFTVEYYFSKGRPHINATCRIDARNNKLSSVACKQTN